MSTDDWADVVFKASGSSCPLASLNCPFSASVFTSALASPHLQEVITFTPEALTIERGYGKPDKRHEFHRIFAQIFVRKPLHRWYGSKVAIRSKGKEVEVGGFLSEDERKSSSRTCAPWSPTSKACAPHKARDARSPRKGATATNAPPGRTLPCPASANPSTMPWAPVSTGRAPSARQRATTAS